MVNILYSLVNAHRVLAVSQYISKCFLMLAVNDALRIWLQILYLTRFDTPTYTKG